MAKKTEKLNTNDPLAILKAAIDKAHGAGTVTVGRDQVVPVESFSTGVLTLDEALGCGGFPRGRLVELFGPESSGKTTTCLQLISACQKHYFEQSERFGVAAFIDAEHAFDPDWATNCGVDVDKLMFSQPDYGEQGLEIAELMADSGSVDLIVIDSVAALVPKAELDGELTESHIGVQARMMSKACRKLASKCKRSKTSICFINQIREKIGVMFGSPETTPGGRALKFYASIRIDVRKGTAIKEGEVVVANETKAKIVKNKVAPPFTVAEYTIGFGADGQYGIDMMSALLESGVKHKVIETSGSWFNLGDMRLGQGKSKAVQFLRESPEVAAQIRSSVMAIICRNKPVAINEQDIEEIIDDE